MPEHQSFATDRTDHLNALDYNPYSQHCSREMSLCDFRDAYSERDGLDDVDELTTLAGRIIRYNNLGSLTFLELRDETDTLQVMLDTDHTDNYDDITHIDTADVISVTGTPTRTDTGEFTLHATEYRVLTKTLQHPPSWDGLNERARIEQRTPALWNDELRETLRQRFEMQQSIRSHLMDRGFLEVETPTLHYTESGGDAATFRTDCHALGRDIPLRVAPERYLKRLVIGGFDAIFEIGRNYRNEDSDTSHNPEFTMLEVYQAYADYEDMMALTETLVEESARDICGETELTFRGANIDVEAPWQRVTIEEALDEYAPYSVSGCETPELLARAESDVDVTPTTSRGDVYLRLYEEFVESNLEGPVFVTGFPACSTPLCRASPEDETTLERFEVVIDGMEVANAYTELRDPREQCERLEQSGDSVDEAFVEALGYGLPPTAGLGIGIDRLAMVLTDSSSIKDVLPFPFVRSDHGPV